MTAAEVTKQIEKKLLVNFRRFWVVSQFEFLSAARRASRAIKQERTSTESLHRRLNRRPPGGASIEGYEVPATVVEQRIPFSLPAKLGAFRCHFDGRLYPDHKSIAEFRRVLWIWNPNSAEYVDRLR